MPALPDEEREPSRETTNCSRQFWWLALAGTFAVALTATVPTAGDIGLTWDEPAYRYSQMVSAQWWEQLGKSRSPADLQRVLDPEASALLLAVRSQWHQSAPAAGRAVVATYACDV